MPKRPPGALCLECGEPITQKRFRLHPACARERRNRRKRERRAANPHEYELFECESCGDQTERHYKTQRTCSKRACKAYLQRLRDERRTDRGPSASPTVTCEVCGDVVPRRSGTQILCGKKACSRIRSAFNQRENRRVMARKHWNDCPVCDKVVKDTRKTYHPECRKELRNEKRRVERSREKMRQKKLQKLQESKPRRRSNVPDRPVYTLSVS